MLTWSTQGVAVVCLALSTSACVPGPPSFGGAAGSAASADEPTSDAGSDMTVEDATASVGTRDPAGPSPRAEDDVGSTPVADDPPYDGPDATFDPVAGRTPCWDGRACASESALDWCLGYDDLHSTCPDGTTCGPAADGEDHCLGFAQVAAGEEFGCALTVAGRAFCWGDIEEPPGGTFEEIVAGSAHACGRYANGNYACWGDWWHTLHSVGGSALDIDAEVDLTCVIDDLGDVRCWNENGQHDVVEGPFSAIDVGTDAWCAISASTGLVSCWDGDDCFGVGPGAAAPDVPVSEVAVGDCHACAITETGELECWGANDSNQTAAWQSSGYDQLSANLDTTCGVFDDGAIHCWGAGRGDGQLSPPAGSYVDVDVGWQQACGVRTDGSLECWGELGWSGDAAAP